MVAFFFWQMAWLATVVLWSCLALTLAFDVSLDAAWQSYKVSYTKTYSEPQIESAR